MVVHKIELTENQKQLLNDMETSIGLLKIEINRAKRAKIDVAELEKRLNEAATQRVSLLRVYG